MTRQTRAIVAGMGIVGLVATATASIQPIQARKSPAFTANDQLRMARTLCGAAARGTAIDEIAGSKDTVSGFLSKDGRTLHVELLSTSFEAGGVPRHVIVFGGHFVEDGTIASSQGARADICVGVLEHRGGTWTPIAHQASLTETGFNGRDPVVALQSIGADRHAVEITQSLWSGGSGMTVVTLYEPEAGPNGGTFSELVSAATSADDCGASERCFRYEGSLTYAPAPANDSSAARDLHLILKGTYRNVAGRIVKIPAAPLVLRLAGGSYAPVSQTASAQSLWKAVQAPWGE